MLVKTAICKHIYIHIYIHVYIYSKRGKQTEQALCALPSSRHANAPSENCKFDFERVGASRLSSCWLGNVGWKFAQEIRLQSFGKL